VAAKAEV
jgi:hypothetical protein